jgi:cytochrome b561
VVAVAHIVAALQHYFIDKDSVLQRMLPRALGGR